MKRINRILLLFLASLAIVALPAAAFSQGRGWGQDRKYERFVNGHDARDGRWDVQQRRFRDRRLDNDDFRRDRWRDQRFEFRRRRFDDNFDRWQRSRFRNGYYRRGW